VIKKKRSCQTCGRGHHSSVVRLPSYNDQKISFTMSLNSSRRVLPPQATHVVFWRMDCCQRSFLCFFFLFYLLHWDSYLTFKNSRQLSWLGVFAYWSLFFGFVIFYPYLFCKFFFIVSFNVEFLIFKFSNSILDLFFIHFSFFFFCKLSIVYNFSLQSRFLICWYFYI